MGNACKQYNPSHGLLRLSPDAYHTCATCRWRLEDNPKVCTPPGYGHCTTEDKQCSRVNCDGCEHRLKRCLARDHWVCLVANRTMPLD